ncbi:hypothetical protein KEM55_002660, partial [Ascosphaera atra]
MATGTHTPDGHNGVTQGQEALVGFTDGSPSSALPKSSHRSEHEVTVLPDEQSSLATNGDTPPPGLEESQFEDNSQMHGLEVPNGNQTPGNPRDKQDQPIIETPTRGKQRRAKRPSLLRKVRLRAVSIGLRQDIRASQSTEESDGSTQKEEKKHRPALFFSRLWERISKPRMCKQHRASNYPDGPIDLVDNDRSTSDETSHAESTDEESDGNFSATELFNQEYHEEQIQGQGDRFRMVRYIPRETSQGPRNRSGGAAQTQCSSDLIYVPYSPDADRKSSRVKESSRQQRKKGKKSKSVN